MTERSDAPVAAAPKRSFVVRRVDATNQFEIFFVSAIATILLVRGILAATGWPQLGGGKIHFAHLLWGGLGMVIAIIYVIFVGLFFLFRWLGSIKHLSPQTALVNAFDYAKEAVLRDMDEARSSASWCCRSR